MTPTETLARDMIDSARNKTDPEAAIVFEMHGRTKVVLAMFKLRQMKCEEVIDRLTVINDATEQALRHFRSA